MTINASYIPSDVDEVSLRRLAAEVFGTITLAQNWFDQPAMALNQRRPSDLMGTIAGRELVRTILGRIDFGVYT